MNKKTEERGLSRRSFLTSVALGAGVGLASQTGQGTQTLGARRAPLCTPTTKPVLTADDFTYLGYYDIQTNGSNSTYAQGLTHRYVNGELRFLNKQLNGRLDEISIAGVPYGDKILARTRGWMNIGSMSVFYGFWWDEASQRLWSSAGPDYTANVIPTIIATRTLNDDATASADGSVSALHTVSLQGVPAKRAYGGVQPVPLWFQQQYGVAPYVVGWGGYTSLMAQGGGCSLGPTMYAMPDPLDYPDTAAIPASAFRTLMDDIGGTTHTDWYKNLIPTSYDRGSRVTIPLNYFDGGDARQNPSTPPSVPPLTTAQWLSPTPDGFGRWVWGDSYYNTGQWIDGPNKHGFMAIGCFGGGKCWYQNSTLRFDRRIAELHIFDPATLGEVAQGVRPAWNAKPANMTELNLPGMGTSIGTVGNAAAGNVAGATYDPVSQRLYVLGLGMGASVFFNRLYAFQVAA